MRRSGKRAAWIALLLVSALTPLGAESASSPPNARSLLQAGEERLRIAIAAFDSQGVLEATDLFRRTLAVNPRFAEAEVGLAEALLWLGDYAAAHQALDRAEALRVPGVRPNLLRARLHILSG